MGYKHNKEDIVEAGAELFRKQGYHNVGINDVLKSCNIPKGSFYNFFTSKEDFAVQVIHRYAEQSRQIVKSHLSDQTSTPLARLKNLYQGMIAFQLEDGCANGCLINNISVEVGGINDKLSQVTNQKFLEIIKDLTVVVQEAQDLGEIISDQPAAELAEYLHSGFFGALSRMKVNRNPVYLKKWYDMTFNFISS